MEPLPADRGELAELWDLARRSLRNAALEGLTEDGRFLFAYMAIRTLTAMAIRIEGHRVTARGGAHFNTFEALRIFPPALSERADYFDDCRRKRNEASYEAVRVSPTEADELLREAFSFRSDLVYWLERTHPRWARAWR